jgi:hypothetical protein
LLAALLLLAATLVVGCGSQSANYEGTWIQKALPNSSPETPIVIKKVGDKYAFSSPNGESFGYMLHTTATDSGQTTLYSMVLDAGAVATQDGGKLKLSNGKDTLEFTVSGDTMTMVVPGVQAAFTFSRVATK